MPLPEPAEDENLREFFNRCMGDEEINKEFPERDQRAAVCRNQYEEK